MSSILKALKKLESEKAQRDELSTAVASDILRTSRHKRVKSFSLVIFGSVIALMLIAGYAFLSGVQIVAPEQAATTASPDTAQAAPAGVITSTPEMGLSRPAVLPQPALTPKLPELTGIIYQEEAASRLAIINDLPVMEGTFVEGFTVRAILPYKVVVSRDGINYDLNLPLD